MKKSTRMLLGISIALITAASLNFTIGNRFHQRYGWGHHGWGRHGWGHPGWGRDGGPHYGHRDCGGGHSGGGADQMEDSSPEPAGTN